MLKSILVLVLCLIVMPSLASKLTAVATGDWDDNTTWDGVHPGCYDSICIPVGIVVTIRTQEDLDGCSAVLIFIEGRVGVSSRKKNKTTIW